VKGGPGSVIGVLSSVDVIDDVQRDSTTPKPSVLPEHLQPLIDMVFPSFLDTMQTGADQGLELGCMSPAVNILSSSLSITSFVARGVLGAL
jgi:hypothetical protein